MINKFRINLFKVNFIFGAILVTLTFTNCTPKITEEQLAQLKELRKKEKSLGEDIAKTQREIPAIEAEIRSRASELKDCTDKKDFITQKLSQWPNVWPDYTPGSETPSEPKK